MNPAVIDTVLAGLNVDRDVRDAIVGDLIEEGAQRAAAHGRRSADRWLRRQTRRSVAAFVLAALRDGGFRLLAATVGPALAALLAVGLLIAASAALVSALVAPETLGRLTVVVFAIDLGYGVAGGYVAARLGRTAPFGAALVLGVIGVALTQLSAGDVHAWYRVALQLLLMPATVGGGWLRARQLARRSPLA